MTWVAAGVASGTATLAAVNYFNNKNNQKKDAKNRPQYEIPDEIKKNLTDAQAYAAHTAMQGLPEEQKAQYLANLQKSTAYSLNQLGSRRGGLSGIATLNQNQNQGYFNLLAQDSAAKTENQRFGQQLVSGARQEMANYKGQEFQLNKINPFYENIARRDANNAQLSSSLNSAGSMIGGISGGGKSSPPPQQNYPQQYSYPQQYQMGSYQTDNRPMTTQNPGDPYGGQPLDFNNGYKGGSYWY